MKLNKTSHFLKRSSNQSGQAMIEYVLLLVITIALIFMAKGLFTNLNQFMTGYVGGYFKCLMDYGELPSLGVEDKDLRKHTSEGYQCKIGTNFQAQQSNPTPVKVSGTTANNTKPVGSTKATAGRRGNSALNEKSNSEKDRARRLRGRSLAGDDSGSDVNFRSRSSSYAAGDLDDVEGGGSRQTRIGGSPYAVNQPKKTEAKGLLENKNAKRTTNSRILVLNKPNSKESENLSYGPKNKKTKLIPPERKLSSTEDSSKESEFSFGYIFKWLMIAAIAIVIFILFGSQILNYSKSDS